MRWGQCKYWASNQDERCLLVADCSPLTYQRSSIPYRGSIIVLSGNPPPHLLKFYGPRDFTFVIICCEIGEMCACESKNRRRCFRQEEILCLEKNFPITQFTRIKNPLLTYLQYPLLRLCHLRYTRSMNLNCSCDKNLISMAKEKAICVCVTPVSDAIRCSPEHVSPKLPSAKWLSSLLQKLESLAWTNSLVLWLGSEPPWRPISRPVFSLLIKLNYNPKKTKLYKTLHIYLNATKNLFHWNNLGPSLSDFNFIFNCNYFAYVFQNCFLFNFSP